MKDPRPYNDDRLHLARCMNIQNTAGWDPWVDANHDYQVLCWVRDNQIFSKRKAFFVALDDLVASQGDYHIPWPDAALFYRIGHYAEAAILSVATTQTQASIDA